MKIGNLDIGGFSRKELLIGAGNSRIKYLSLIHRDWYNLTTLDLDPTCGADVIHDLTTLPLPFEENSFDEIHAYEVLEHTGQQGDYKFFFKQFSEFWRILRPGGHLFGTSPSINSPWLWGDPGHTRVISEEIMTFLIQPEYTKQIGVSDMTDYRYLYQADFDLVLSRQRNSKYEYILQAVKPSRVNID